MLTRSSLSLLVLFSCLLPAMARADAPVYLWGVQRGCERLPDVDRLAEKRLQSPARTVRLLTSPDGKPLPPCQGDRCADVFRRACPSTAGRLLGGQVVQGKATTRFRLWLYDLSTGQTAYQDDYCQWCSLTDALIVQAQSLIDKPRFRPAPGAQPMYCATPATLAERSAAETKNGPLFLTVYGEGKHIAALHAALKQQLEALGRTPLPVSIESSTYTLDILQRIVSDKQNARVLGAEVKKDGRVELFFFDQKTAFTHDKSVTCFDCDRDSLVTEVKQAAADLLDRCFGMQCAGTTAHPPVEACDPFPEYQCPGLDALQGLSTGGGMSQDHLTPRTARLIKGLAWGSFAVSAATALSLAIANPVVTRQNNGHVYEQTLIAPAWTAAGLSVGILAAAIPLTIMVNRSQHSTSTAPPSSSTLLAPSLQCPN